MNVSSPEVNASSTCIYLLSLLGSIDSGIFPLYSFIGRKPAFTSGQLRYPSFCIAESRQGTVPICRAPHLPPGDCPPVQRPTSATPRPFPPPAPSTAPFAATLRPPPALLARQFPSLFALLLCLFRYPPSSGRRCVQFSLLFIVKLHRAVRSFPSADPASPSVRLRHYRLSPIKRPAAFRRARFMHRIIRRQAHYRLQMIG